MLAALHEKTEINKPTQTKKRSERRKKSEKETRKRILSVILPNS